MRPSATEPIQPMLAKAVDHVPLPDDVEGGLLYEPKWDGFRAIVYVDGADVAIGSRGSKMLTRYFPELVDQFRRQCPGSFVFDGEIVVRTGPSGAELLGWDALSARIHPAARRVAALAEATPASFVAFDLLADGADDLTGSAFEVRRERLVEAAARFEDPLFVSRTTHDPSIAERWLAEFEGAGLDGVVAKPLAAKYSPNKRIMLKVKHHRTADVVVVGYRVHTPGSGVGSLLLGLHDDAEGLTMVGGASAFSDRRRGELVDELAPHLVRDAEGEPVSGETERSRFSAGKDLSFLRLDGTLVAEVRYDQMAGTRFRHTVQFLRWRPDRDAASCTFEQLDVPTAYDLSDVLD